MGCMSFRERYIREIKDMCQGLACLWEIVKHRQSMWDVLCLT